ncbi:hypothetical protein MAR_006021 [Mya arenaria]|uniref:Uncharacterized protein n=1 Tax=Mya arenaria TaxID=6604 RepID=A0ABY7DB33_MYAAR|nr:hypothetical protein MAR_006021 [Mya arenaria]
MHNVGQQRLKYLRITMYYFGKQGLCTNVIGHMTLGDIILRVDSMRCFLCGLCSPKEMWGGVWWSTMSQTWGLGIVTKSIKIASHLPTYWMQTTGCDIVREIILAAYNIQQLTDATKMAQEL